MEAGDTMGKKRECNFLGNKPSFASILHEESSKKKANFRTLVTDSTYKVAFPVVERSLLNSWKKYCITRVMGDKQEEELTYVLVWIKFHGILVSAFIADGLSVIATRLGTSPHYVRFVYYRHMYANLGGMDYVRPLVGIRVDRALKDTMPLRCGTCSVFGHDDMRCLKRVMADLRKQGGTSNDGFQTVQMKYFRGPLGIKKRTVGPPGSKKRTVGNHNLPKQQMPKYVCQKKTASTSVSNSFSALEEDSDRLMDDLVDDTLKKMEAPLKKIPKKTGIWSRRKADSPKINVVFSPETKVRYFDKDYMDFDNTGQAVEEVEHSPKLCHIYIEVVGSRD
nr:hypothetical protein [Tanacetum cinerariifolium]